MNCRDVQGRLMELARGRSEAGPELQAHLAECQECRRFFDGQAALGVALARLAQENAAALLPAGVEARVFAAWPARPAAWSLWRPIAAAALAASLAAAVFLGLRPADPVHPPANARSSTSNRSRDRQGADLAVEDQARQPSAGAPARVALKPSVEIPFVEIPFVAPLAPYERAEVQRMDVPVAALVAAGFEVHVPDTAGTVQADVLVGQDGRAHAIRLIAEANR